MVKWINLVAMVTTFSGDYCDDTDRLVAGLTVGI